MKKIYPIVITEDNEDFIVYVPDFDINTQGNSIADAMFMAKDAIGMCGISMQDEGKSIPEPRTLKLECQKNEMVALIEIDFALFREKEDNRAVKKNCTIPLWLSKEAEAHNINFSQVLQDALKKHLDL